MRESLTMGIMLRMRTLPAGFIAPCLPTKADTLPSGGLWIHEIKHDGFRIIARKDGERVTLYSRPGNDFTQRFPPIARALTHLRCRSCIIDGEAVICDHNGVTCFDHIRYRRADDGQEPHHRRHLPTSVKPSLVMVGEAGDLSASRDPPQTPSVSRPGFFLFELWPELASVAAGGVLPLLTASLFPPGGCSKNRRAPVVRPGLPSGCSPLLLCVGGVSLPGGATCRDNLKQAKTFRAIR